MMDFAGGARRLADIDLPRIGAKIGCGEDEIHAFLEVETSGGGYDAQARPKMLFEPHVFYRNLPAAKRDRAVSAGLAYAKWKPGAYPKDSYPRLQLAIEIDETAALRAASWGIGQVLGENHVAAGYRTVQAMVQAFVSGGEAEQLEAAIRYILHEHLDDELRNHNWAGFARGYNGSAYAQNGYDRKLAAAYAKWARIGDTPYLPEPVASAKDTITAPIAVPSGALSPNNDAQPLAPPGQPNLDPPSPASASSLLGWWRRLVA